MLKPTPAGSTAIQNISQELKILITNCHQISVVFQIVNKSKGMQLIFFKSKNLRRGAKLGSVLLTEGYLGVS